MEVFAFAAFIVLGFLVFAFLRLRLASIGSEKRPAKGSANGIEYRNIIRIASFLTLGIATACLLLGLLLILDPRSDPSLTMTITGIGLLLTLAIWAGALAVAALVATVRTVGGFIEPALDLFLILLRIPRVERRALPKPSRITCGNGGVVDEWLDGP